MGKSFVLVTQQQLIENVHIVLLLVVYIVVTGPLHFLWYSAKRLYHNYKKSEFLYVL